MKTKPKQKREKKSLRDLLDRTIGQVSMASTSYFNTEYKLNEKSYYHAWNMTLDLTLDEHELLDYV